MNQHKKINDNYTSYEEKLGEGAFGVIYKGYSKRDKCIVAIKKLKPEGATQWFTDPKFKLETEVLLKIKHPNVVRVYEALEIGRDVYIIMEFCDAGDLKKLMQRSKRENQEARRPEVPNQGPLSSVKIFDMFCQMVAGMAEVNRLKYLHRDLKLENVMLMDDGTIKIADFGLARGIVGNDLFKLERMSAKGTPLYAAPNILLKEEYSVKCDVFSMGLMLYELLTGVHLFADARNMENLKALQKSRLCDNKLILPQTINGFFQDILRKMITYYEDDRTDFFSLEKDIIPARLQIGQSMDETYNYKDLSTGKLVGEINPYKPSNTPHQNTQSTQNTHTTQSSHGIQIVRNTPNTMSTNFNPNAGTTTMITAKQIEEKFNSRKTELFNFAYYVYKRGRLMVDLMQLINQSSYPLPNFCKYTLAFLELGIFMNANREMNQYLSSKMIKLPSGTEFNVTELPHELQANLQAEINTFTKQIESEELEFGKLLKQLHGKLTSVDYRTKFAKAYETYPDIYAALDYLVVNNQLQSAEFFTYYFDYFLKHECIMRDYRQQPEQAVRTFNMALVLCQLRGYLPDSDYTQGDTVEYVRQNFNTMPLESIYHRIHSTIGI